jgi:hypothetical protein
MVPKTVTALRVCGFSILHGGIIGIAIYYRAFSMEAMTLMFLEVFVYLCLLSSDPGYILSNSMDHEILALSEGEVKHEDEDVDNNADDTDPNPLIPLHWSKLKWKMG